jgi:type IV pilus assembly protein PilP
MKLLVSSFSTTDTRLGLSLLISLLMLSACTVKQDELQEWMKQQEREVRPNVTPISAPKKFTPQPYQGLNAIEPYSTQKLTVAVKQENKQPNSILAVEARRRKEPLEAYPLDNLKMVGSMIKHARPFALVQADKLLYQVKVGDYMGQNFGKIVRINETEVVLREIVQDAAGEWIERNEAIQLQEKAR